MDRNLRLVTTLKLQHIGMYASSASLLLYLGMEKIGTGTQVCREL